MLVEKSLFEILGLEGDVQYWVGSVEWDGELASDQVERVKGVHNLTGQTEAEVLRKLATMGLTLDEGMNRRIIEPNMFLTRYKILDTEPVLTPIGEASVYSLLHPRG